MISRPFAVVTRLAIVRPYLYSTPFSRLIHDCDVRKSSPLSSMMVPVLSTTLSSKVRPAKPDQY